MKSKFEFIKVSSSLSIFGLIVLLLLSPCKVRNSIQAELGVPQTKTLNKSQATISYSSCHTFEVSETILSTSKTSSLQAHFLISGAYHFDFAYNSIRHFYNHNASRDQLVSEVPLYILYQNLKVYS